EADLGLAGARFTATLDALDALWCLRAAGRGEEHPRYAPPVEHAPAQPLERTKGRVLSGFGREGVTAAHRWSPALPDEINARVALASRQSPARARTLRCRPDLR